MHEATRRLLGVLLRQLDGFKEQSKTVVIGATNRKQDLDPALLRPLRLLHRFWPSLRWLQVQIHANSAKRKEHSS